MRCSVGAPFGGWAILLAVSLTGVRHVTTLKLALFWALTIVLLLVLRSATRMWRMIEDVLAHASIGGRPSFMPVPLETTANQVAATVGLRHRF